MYTVPSIMLSDSFQGLYLSSVSLGGDFYENTSIYMCFSKFYPGEGEKTELAIQLTSHNDLSLDVRGEKTNAEDFPAVEKTKAYLLFPILLGEKISKIEIVNDEMEMKIILESSSVLHFLNNDSFESYSIFLLNGGEHFI